MFRRPPLHHSGRSRGHGERPGWSKPASGEQPRQWTTAFSAPAPVSERTSISAYFSRLERSLLVIVPIQPSRNASGIETRPGLSSGNQWKSTEGSVIIDRLRAGFVGPGLPDTTGEKTISVIAVIRPPYMLHRAPRVLNRAQKSEYRIVGKFALAAMANASATTKPLFWPL